MSKNICVTDRFKGSIYYHAVCDCGTHCHTVLLEHEDDLPSIITLSMYGEIHYSEWFCDSWYGKICRRIKHAWSILFHGYQKDLEGSFLFQGEESIRDYISALEEGIEKIKNDVQVSELS